MRRTSYGPAGGEVRATCLLFIESEPFCSGHKIKYGLLGGLLHDRSCFDRLCNYLLLNSRSISFLEFYSTVNMKCTSTKLIYHSSGENTLLYWFVY